MALLKVQLDYAERRLREIVSTKQSSFIRALGDRPRTELTEIEKDEQLRAGTAKLKSKKEVDNLSSYRWRDYFTYTMPAELVENKKKAAEWDKAILKNKTKLEKRQKQILDKLYLADAAEALKAIDKFAEE